MKRNLTSTGFKEPLLVKTTSWAFSPVKIKDPAELKENYFLVEDLNQIYNYFIEEMGTSALKSIEIISFQDLTQSKEVEEKPKWDCINPP